MSPKDLLQAEGLVKIYGGKRVVNQVDIVVHRKEIVGLLGPNGAGKTTTFYMMVGLTHPDEGHVFLDGEDITVDPMHMRARKGISYLAQEPSIFRKADGSAESACYFGDPEYPSQREKIAA